MFTFYVSVVFGSNLFGAVCSPNTSALGSDPVLYALLTAIVLLVVFNWHHMPGPTLAKVLRLFTLTVVVVIIVFILSKQASTAGSAWLLLSEQIKYPDLYGSLGGVVYGAVASLCILPSKTRDIAGGIPKYCKVISAVSLVTLATLTATLLAVFYAGPNPPIMPAQ